jgi:hypothetical protein
MTEKKRYTAPQLFRVELNQEQAILSACSLLASNAMAGGMDVFCRSGSCKQAGGGAMADSGQRPS